MPKFIVSVTVVRSQVCEIDVLVEADSAGKAERLAQFAVTEGLTGQTVKDAIDFAGSEVELAAKSAGIARPCPPANEHYDVKVVDGEVVRGDADDEAE